MARDSKNIIRLRVHKRIRARVSGTEERPRLAVFRSVKHIYAQVIDDGTRIFACLPPKASSSVISML